jgi:hypothetical protein
MSRWRKFAALSTSDRRLLFEAALLLFRARVELAIRPFAKVVCHVPPGGAPGTAAEVPRMGWAVETVARSSPVPLTCLPQALAAWWMLRSRGHQARLIYGVSKDRHTGFAAHAWVELNGIAVVGGRAARGFTVLTSFPQE